MIAIWRRTDLRESLNISSRRKEEMSWAFQLQRDGRGSRYMEGTRRKGCETGELESRDEGGLMAGSNQRSTRKGKPQHITTISSWM